MALVGLAGIAEYSYGNVDVGQLVFAVALAFGGGWFSFRGFRAVVAVSDSGLLKRGLLFSRWFSWSDIVDVEIVVDHGLLDWRVPRLSVSSGRPVWLHEVGQLRDGPGRASELVAEVERHLAVAGRAAATDDAGDVEEGRWVGPWRRPPDSVVLLKGRALDVVLSQAALWVLMPWFVLAIGWWIDPVVGAAAWLVLAIPVVMAIRLAAVGVYLERGQVVVRNVLWTWRLDPPVKRVGERSSLWAAPAAPVAVLRSDATGRRCKAVACSDAPHWDELRDQLRRHSVLALGPVGGSTGPRSGGRRRTSNRRGRTRG
jgi:hypothetical protein